MVALEQEAALARLKAMRKLFPNIRTGDMGPVETLRNQIGRSMLTDLKQILVNPETGPVSLWNSDPSVAPLSVYISDTHLYNRGQDLTGHTLRLAQGEAIRVILSELGVPKIFFEFLRIQERYIAPIMENEDPRAGYKVATQIPGIIVEHLVGRNASTLHLQAA